MKSQAWMYVQTLLEIMKELGAEVKEDRLQVTVALPNSQDKVILSKNLISVRYASFELTSSGVKDDCPFYSADLVFNDWTYVGLRFDNPSNEDYADFADHMAYFIDRMKKRIFHKYMPDKLEELITTYHEIHLKFQAFRTRELYLMWKQTKQLVESEYLFWKRKRTRQNEHNKAVYERLLDLKQSLPHALHYTHSYGIFVQKRKVPDNSIASRYCVSKVEDGIEEQAAYTNNPYQSVRSLLKQTNRYRNSHLLSAARS